MPLWLPPLSDWVPALPALLLAAACAAPAAWAALHSRHKPARWRWAAVAALLAATAGGVADLEGQALLQVDGRLARAGCAR